jgi:RNA polymerase II subunit A small phosphatase-like protein
MSSAMAALMTQAPEAEVTLSARSTKSSLNDGRETDGSGIATPSAGGSIRTDDRCSSGTSSSTGAAGGGAGASSRSQAEADPSSPGTRTKSEASAPGRNGKEKSESPPSPRTTSGKTDSLRTRDREAANKADKRSREKADAAARFGSSNQESPPEGQLGPQVGRNIGRKTLVLDLDETLIHSSFRAVPNADIVITVELEGEHHKVYVLKRPGVDEFLLEVAKLYEVVVYTASMSKYAIKLLDELDVQRVCAFRLFREACTKTPQGYVKDLSRLGRELKDVIIIDNSPVCYAFQPDNAIPIKTWRDDPSDRELMDLTPILSSLATVDNIPVVLRQIIWTDDE